MADEPGATPPSTATSGMESEISAFFDLWAASMAQVFGQIANAPFAVECRRVEPPHVPAPEPSDKHLMATAAGALRGELSLRVPRATILSLGQLFLSESQDTSAQLKPDHEQAAEELLRQVAGHVATGLNQRWGEVQLTLQSSAAPSWPAAVSRCLVSAAGSPCQCVIACQLSAALNSALAAAFQTSQPHDETGNEASAETALPASEGNLNLLLDVELEVVLRFGERSMLLRDILELGAGSVVELDRKVNEPVDLLLDGRLIARGEVVVVDGNYGLRVLEVGSSPLIAAAS